MIFATFVIEREPLRWQDLPLAIQGWIENAGAFAVVALAIYGLFYLLHRPPGGPRSGLQRLILGLALFAMFTGYALCGYLYFFPGRTPARGLITRSLRTDALLLGASGALIAVLLPFLIDLTRLRWRRIWALAKLSFKEAVRRRVLWVFSALILVFLFASWFLPYKPEDQVRNYVWVVYWAMAPLLLVTAGLVAAFSIPADVRNQTIHTIVTKPVERFEIVLGRFIGYILLLTMVLLVMTGVSLLYLIREIDPDAKFESMRARVPLYGELAFRGKSISVGREWAYRGYIPGGPGSQERAVWTYQNLPSNLASKRQVSTIPCEFTFDIFRTYKGEEGKGVLCSFSLLTSNWDANRRTEFDLAKAKGSKFIDMPDRRALIEEAYREIRPNSPKPTDADIQAFISSKEPGAPQKLIDNLISEEFGAFEILNKVVVDYHTQSLDLPTGIFKNLQKQRESQPKPAADDPGELTIVVRCDSASQYLGVAKYDFYILDDERPFWLNFFKGAAGLWLRLCIVVGLAVALSTYLSGVIAWLTTMFIYIAGLMQDEIRKIAENQSIGGGPMEAALRLATRENIATPMDNTPGRNLAVTTDIAYRWILRQFLDILPDIDRLDWTEYVAEGFNISTTGTLLLNTLVVAAYLLPWAILAYYLIKSREIAA